MSENGAALEVVHDEYDEAIGKAWTALARYKFEMFGYWASKSVSLGHLLVKLGGRRPPSPFHGLVTDARAECGESVNQVAAPLFAAILARRGCKCWVQHVSPETAFVLRYGAHGFDCPVYAPSGDPVDRANDDEIRERGERGRIR